MCKYLNEEKNDIVIKCEDIKNVTIFKANTMTVFVDEKDGESHKEKVFEITGDFSFNALKYRDLFEILCKG